MPETAQAPAAVGPYEPLDHLDHDGVVMLKKAFGKRIINRGQREADPEMLVFFADMVERHCP